MLFGPSPTPIPPRIWTFITVTCIDLASWNSNFYRYSRVLEPPSEDSLEFRQVYLRYQHMHCNVTFEIDDSGISMNEFTYSDVYPYARELSATNPTPTATNTLCIRTYSERQGNSCFTLAFGQCFWWNLVVIPWARSLLDRLMCLLQVIPMAVFGFSITVFTKDPIGFSDVQWCTTFIATCNKGWKDLDRYATRVFYVSEI